MSAQANDDVESYQKAVSNENSPQCKDISDAMVRMPSPLPEQKSEQVIESKPQSGEYEEPRKVRKWGLTPCQNRGTTPSEGSVGRSPAAGMPQQSATCGRKQDMEETEIQRQHRNH